MSNLLKMLKINFTSKPVISNVERGELTTETNEAFALRLVSQKYNFGSEERYVDAASQLCELARIVALDNYKSSRSRVRSGNLRLVVNNQI